MVDATIQISAADKASSDFLDLPYRLYKGEPAWRAPLRMEAKARFSPKNPAVKSISARFFTATMNGDIVGRIAAFINAEHDAAHGKDTAFFGYFDFIDHPNVADQLLEAAKKWAREQGRKRLRGPSMWSVNEEVGLLVDGFEHPPAILMPYGKRYMVEAIERNGLEKATDLYAFMADLTDGAPKAKLVQNLRRKAESDSALTWRSLNPSDFMGDVRMARDIFNDAWSENWGFIPFSDTQFTHMAKDMKPIMFRDGFQIGFIDGEPTAFVWMIPDVNEAAHGLNGHLLPFGWVKFLWRLKTKKVTQGRIPLMGLKKKFQKGRRGVALTTEICSRAFDAGKAQGFSGCELSWVLEDNDSMVGICNLVNATHYKTYRMVEAIL